MDDDRNRTGLTEATQPEQAEEDREEEESGGRRLLGMFSNKMLDIAVSFYLIYLSVQMIGNRGDVPAKTLPWYWLAIIVFAAGGLFFGVGACILLWKESREEARKQREKAEENEKKETEVIETGSYDKYDE